MRHHFTVEPDVVGHCLLCVLLAEKSVYNDSAPALFAVRAAYRYFLRRQDCKANRKIVHNIFSDAMTVPDTVPVIFETPTRLR